MTPRYVWKTVCSDMAREDSQLLMEDMKVFIIVKSQLVPCSLSLVLLDTGAFPLPRSHQLERYRDWPFNSLRTSIAATEPHAVVVVKAPQYGR
ncbi:hypothetical protein GQ600_21431 [Phytophthora cactorum]|nr:hypothetical protein GQ600_21431 [Phytophthora cactorum]